MSGGHNQPRTLEEMHEEEEEIKAAEHLHESIKGFYLTDPFNEEIESERLGVRDDIAHQLEHDYGGHGKRVQDVILDARVTEQLRKMVKEHKSHEHPTAWRFVPGSEEWKKNRKREINNAVRTVFNPIKRFNENYDEYAEVLEHEFGHATDVSQMQEHILSKAFDGLTQSDLDQMWVIVTGHSIPPSAVSIHELTNELNKKSPLELSDIIDVFSTTISSDLHRLADFEKYAELQKIVANEKAKVLSMQIYNPHRLRHDFVHDIQKTGAPPEDSALSETLGKLLGKKFDEKLEHDHKLQALVAELEFKRKTDPAKLNKVLGDMLAANPEADRTVVVRELSEAEKQNNVKIDEYLGKVNANAKKLHGKDEEKEEVDAALKKLTDEKKDVKDLKTQKKGEEKVVQDKIDDAKNRKKGIIKKTNDLNADVLKEERNLNNIKSEDERLNKKLRDDRAKIPGLNDEQRGLEKKLEEAKRKKLDDEVTNLEGKIQEVKDKKTAIQTEIAALEKEVEANDKERKNANTTLDHKRDELKNQNSDKTEVEHELEKYDKELKDIAAKDEFHNLRGRETDLETKEKDLTKKQKELIKEVEHAEAEFQSSANDFVRFIEFTMKKKIHGTPATHDVKIKLFKDAISAAHVDRTFIKNLIGKITFKNEFEEEIETLKAVGTKIEGLMPDYILFELKKADIHGHYTEEQKLKIARMATSFAEIDAKNVELFRAANREIAESKVVGWSPEFKYAPSLTLPTVIIQGGKFGGQKIGPIKIPKVILPEVHIQGGKFGGQKIGPIKIPKVTIPEVIIQGGKFGGQKIGPITIPEFTIPDVVIQSSTFGGQTSRTITIPEFSLPDVIIQSSQFGGQTLGTITIPQFTMPDTIIQSSKFSGKIKMKGLGGLWRKAKQQVASSFFHTDTFRARDIIEHIAGLDHAFEAFKDLLADASLADVRSAIKHHGGMSNDTLMKFYLHLQEALKSFTVDHHRIVEIADRDWTLEQVASFAEKIHAEIEAREFVHKIEHPETEEDKKLKDTNPAAFFQKMLKQRDESLKALEAKHLEELRRPDSNWQVSFLKSLMKGKFGETYERLLKEAKEKGLSGEDLKRYISQEGKIPNTILHHLMTGLALKEGFHLAGKVASWTKSKLGGACRAAASGGVKHGSRLVGGIWNHMVKPVGKATGRGLWKATKGTANFFIGKPLRFFFYEQEKKDKEGNVKRPPGWSFFKAPKNIAKGLFFPFVLAGRGAKGFWNFFSYTEEDRKRDAAWYAAKKGAAAGHGGGGHGAGGGHH